MKKANHLTWSLLIQGGAQPGASEVVLAMNKHDPDRLRVALENASNPEDIVLSWVQTQKDHGIRCGLIEAACRMDWAVALPILHEAGLQPHRDSLEYATVHKRASCVKHLLAMGLKPDGNPGAPTLRLLPVDDVRPDRHATQVRIARHYTKAGANPWAQCTKGKWESQTLVEYLLGKNHLGVVDVLLGSARERGLSAPQELLDQPEPMWAAMTKGFEPYLTHATHYILSEAAPALLSVMGNLQRTFGNPPSEVVQALWYTSVATFNKKPTASRAHGMHAWAQGLLWFHPDDTALAQGFIDFFNDNLPHLIPEHASHWQHAQLQRGVATLQHQAARPRL